MFKHVLTILKNMSQLGSLFPTEWKNKHVPNHQPDDVRWLNPMAQMAHVAPSNETKVMAQVATSSNNGPLHKAVQNTYVMVRYGKIQ